MSSTTWARNLIMDVILNTKIFSDHPHTFLSEIILISQLLSNYVADSYPYAAFLKFLRYFWNI